MALSQNGALQGASPELRTCFQEKGGRNALLSVDEESYRQIDGIRYQNVCWGSVGFLADLASADLF